MYIAHIKIPKNDIRVSFGKEWNVWFLMITKFSPLKDFTRDDSDNVIKSDFIEDSGRFLNTTAPTVSIYINVICILKYLDTLSRSGRPPWVRSERCGHGECLRVSVPGSVSSALRHSGLADVLTGPRGRTTLTRCNKHTITHFYQFSFRK